MHTILGANGAIAIGIAKELAAHNETIRLVSRAPRAVNPTDNLLPADITVRENVFEAAQGSSVVYLTAGFPYNLAVWEQTCLR